jgi:ubiquinone biosynthesis protein COQ9
MKDKERMTKRTILESMLISGTVLMSQWASTRYSSSGIVYPSGDPEELPRDPG